MNDVPHGRKDDPTLMRLGQQGFDQDSLYAKAAAEFAKPLARLAAAYESDAARQQDLLQEIHFSLWRSLATFAEQCSLRTWVYRVAHNTASTYVRQRMRHRRTHTITLEDLDDLDQAANVESHVDDLRLLEKLNGLIGRLKPVDRNVLLLYLEGLKAEEIGEVVGILPGNVNQKVHRARMYLRRLLASGGERE